LNAGKMMAYLVPIVAMAVLAFTALLLLSGHAPKITAAFANMFKDSPHAVNGQILGRFLGRVLLFLTGCLLLLFLGAWLVQIWLMIVGVLAFVAVAGVTLHDADSDKPFQRG